MKLNKNHLFFNVNNIYQAIETLSASKSKNIIPIFCIKFFLIDGLGLDWIVEFKNLLLKKFNKKDFKILVSCRKDYGLFINLVRHNLDFLQVKADYKTLTRLKNIAKKNKVTVNPKISIINLSNIKNIRLKIQKKIMEME